ncbi:MAG: hydrogen gas-evolving membrane-bound hydrogenase subunit E [Eubacteriales bacterium]
MKKRISDRFLRWMNGETDLDDCIERENKKKINKCDHPCEDEEIKIIPSLEKRELRFSSVHYRVFSVIFCVILIGVLIGTVYFLPGFADDDAPTVNEVYEHYVGEGRDETGAVNTVAGMILDYRAFDTLGESFVLFTATCAVLILMENKKKKPRDESLDTVNYYCDPIVRTAAKILIPVIFVFGAYILVNGHLSPGGGFSGGAILGAGFILYAMVFGDEKALSVLNEKRIKIITICSLSFYCLEKSYSFFTGNEFNGVHSVISAGTPGNILSSGLIFPLNIAVGLVVCSTMYSFYMLFKRGRM